MTTYLELKAQAEKLLAQAEDLRRKEVDDAIADIKAKIQAYDLTAKDLGLASGATGPRGPRSRPASTPVATIKYRGPNGETWSGGRGRRPKWVMDALASGKKLEDFAAK